MPDEKRTHVIILLDQSGSMGSIRKQAIDGFNEQVRSIQRNADLGGDTWVSFYKFGGGDGTKPHWERVFDARPASALTAIDERSYVPNGITPLYDCVGMALQDAETKSHEGDVGFLFCVISDGLENASREWTAERIAEKVKALQDTGKWTFVYIGANQDLGDVQKHLGIRQVVSYDATPRGYEVMSHNLCASTTGYFESRSSGSTSKDDFWEQKK